MTTEELNRELERIGAALERIASICEAVAKFMADEFEVDIQAYERVLHG